MTYPELLAVIKEGTRARRSTWHPCFELRRTADEVVRLYDTRWPADSVGLPWKQSGYDYHADDYYLIEP